MIWRPKYHSRIAQLSDFFTTIIGLIISYYFAKFLHAIRSSYFPSEFEFKGFYILIIIIIGLLYVFLFKQQKAYSYQRFTSLFKEYTIVINVAFQGAILSITLVFLFGLKEVPRTYFLVFFFTSFILFMIEKTLLFVLAAYIRKKGKDRKRILLIGTGAKAKSIIDIINQNFKWGLDIIGLLTNDKSEVGTEVYGYKILDTYENIEGVFKKFNPQEVLITLSTTNFNQVRNILEVCEREGLTARLNSDFFGKITKNVTIDSIYGLNIITFETVRRSESSLILKRVLDIIISLLALFILAPLMFLAAFLIWITDGRPIIYDWHVVGLDKKPFKSWKFRTMVKDADKLKEKLSYLNEMDGPVFKIKNDPRILPIGRLIRKFSLDETPQLFSVLKGDMSLVGPRPADPHELERYQSWQRRKLSIKPGITCLWQINGRNQINSFDDWVKLDLEYIDNWSILLDIKILLKTIPVVFKGRGAS